jgi:hypothetical protein
MTLEQTLQNQIEESEKLLNRSIDDTIYRSDLEKRIGLINWVLKNIKNRNIPIYEGLWNLK